MEDRRRSAHLLGAAPSSSRTMEKTSPPGRPDTTIRCPRCDSPNTKFCYYNNYSLSQPRHFCKSCKRYWTRGGTLRNVPVGGGCRKNKRLKRPAALKDPPPPPSTAPAYAQHIRSTPTAAQVDEQQIYAPSTRSAYDLLLQQEHLPPQLNSMWLGFHSKEYDQSGYSSSFPIQDAFSETLESPASSSAQQKLLLGLKEGQLRNEFPASSSFPALQISPKLGGDAGILGNGVKTEQDRGALTYEKAEMESEIPNYDNILFSNIGSSTTATGSSLYWINNDANVYGSSSIAPLF